MLKVFHNLDGSRDFSFIYLLHSHTMNSFNNMIIQTSLLLLLFFPCNINSNIGKTALDQPVSLVTIRPLKISSFGLGWYLKGR